MENNQNTNKTSSSKSGTTAKKTTSASTTRKTTATAKSGSTSSGTAKKTTGTGTKRTSTTSTKKSGTTTKKSTTASPTTEVKKDVNKKVDSAITERVAPIKIGDKTINVKGLLKGVSLVAKIIAIVMFVVGALLGAAVGIYFCKDDTFELIECNTSYEIGLDTPIKVEGVKLISFGRDLSDKVKVELSEGLTQNDDGTITINDTSEEGMYYIVYSTDDFKYQKIQRIRYIYIVSFNETGESIVEEG